MENTDNQDLSRTVADMADGFVRRIRRSRISTAIDAPSALDDWEPPPWGGAEYSSAPKIAKANASKDIGRVAADITQRFYPDNGDMVWPADYSSRAKRMEKEAQDAFLIEWALNKALTNALVDSLSDLELKIMLFILNRTWAWKKPREGIPFSHFSKGVFDKGKRLQAPVVKSPGHFSNACKRLEEVRLIRITEARCETGSVNIYEINVGKVISMAEQQQRSALKQK